MEQQIQKAVDCYNAGASVLHLHVRELDGKGSKRLSKFNELIAGIRARVPELFIQVGGSISVAPEGDGEQAKWLSDNARHALAELRSEEHTSELQSLMRNSYAVFCLKKKKEKHRTDKIRQTHRSAH